MQIYTIAIRPSDKEEFENYIDLIRVGLKVYPLQFCYLYEIKITEEDYACLKLKFDSIPHTQEQVQWSKIICKIQP